MLTIPAAGPRVARELEIAERLTNDTIASYADIKKTMMAIRRDTEVPQYAGQDTLMRLQKAEQCLVDAMTNLARVHKGLREEFIEVTSGPEIIKCPAGSLETTFGDAANGRV